MSSNVLMQVIELCRELRDEELLVVVQEATLLQAGFASTQPASIQDVVPIDLPIQHSVDKESGDLKIAYPWPIGLGRSAGWKTVRITPAAQVELAHILYESLSDETLVERSPPKPTSFQ